MVRYRPSASEGAAGEAAIATCTSIIEDKSESALSRASAYYHRGSIFAQQGDHDRAVADYSRAIKLNPKDADAYVFRGLAFGRKGDHCRAIDDFGEAIRLNPRDTKAYYNRGVAYRRKGDPDRAIDDYTEAIKLNPEYADAYYNRAVAHHAKGDDANANADMRKAAELGHPFAKEEPRTRRRAVAVGASRLGERWLKPPRSKYRAFISYSHATTAHAK